MARLTYLEVVNKVLLKLRVSQVTTVAANNYSSLVGELVNEARKDVENALSLRWHDLRVSWSFDTEAGVAIYRMTTFGQDYRVDGIYNSTNNWQLLTPIKSSNWRLFTATGLSGRPDYYRVVGFQEDGDPQLQLYPTPSSTEHTIVMDGFAGQGFISVDDTLISVPSDPVILGAYVRAIEERGDDGGDPMAETRYFDALTTAIAQESSVGGEEHITDFYID